ncbi:hypothetical protein M406DRAFT_231285, partial [Cryphonectria parasitica EP155]
GSHRLVPSGPDNHAGYVWIASILCLIYSGLATIIRTVVKWHVFGLDDHLLFFAMAFLASEILAVIVLCLAKCSTAALILRIFTADGERGKRWVTCWLVVGASTAWGIGSVLALAISCDASAVLTTENLSQCPNQIHRWQAITALDITIDIITCALPAIFTWPMNMPSRLKFKVTAAFIFRALFVVLSGMHLHYLQTYAGAAEPQLAVTDGAVLQQAMIACTIISATVPNLKGFMKAFHTGMGNLGFERPSRGGTKSSSYALQTIGGSLMKGVRGAVRLPSDRSRDRDEMSDGLGGEEEEAGPPRFRPDMCRHETSVVHSNNRSGTTEEEEEEEGRSLRRSGSRELIIRKQVDWKVSHE